MRPLFSTSAAFLSALALAGCRITLGGHDGTSSIVVDGVELEEQHVESMEIDAWAPQGLVVAASLGDVRVVRTEGPNEVVVTLHETVEGDAFLRYEDGRIVGATHSGEPCAIGDVTVRLSSAPDKLECSTGAGDVDVDWCGTAREVRLESGLGDITARDAERVELLLAATGMGSVRVERATCGRLQASSGMGDVDVRECRAESATLESGMGDVEARESSFGKLEASTGMGDVSCRSSSYDEGHLESGLGDVHER